MGAAKERRKAMEAAGIEVVLPPKTWKVTWSFELPPEGRETFERVHKYMREKDNRVPESQESFAAGLLSIGLKTLVAKIAEQEKNEKRVLLHTPGELNEVSKRLQALKQQPGKVVLG